MNYEDLIHTLRDGKEALRRSRRIAPWEEKLQALLRAQQMYVELVGSRRPLHPWEHPWDIMSDVEDSIVIKDGTVTRADKTSPLSAASVSQWVRPRQKWILA